MDRIPYTHVCRCLAAMLGIGAVGVVAGCGGGSSNSSPGAPSVTSVSPATGPNAGGTSVSITGSAFSGATSVMFGSVAATSYTVNSDSSINAAAPAGTGTVYVIVNTPSGTSGTNLSDVFAYGAAPTLASLSPSNGKAGAQVTVTGTGFTGVQSVTFGTVSVAYTVNSPTSVTFTVPNTGLAGGSFNVAVTTGASNSNTLPFAYSL